MIDRHLMQQMDNALSMRAARGLCTNEQALFAFLQFGASADKPDVLSCPNYFRGTPLTYDGHLPSCWINPKGGFYTVEYGGHSSFAAKLGVYDDLLNRAGWIHVSDGRADDYYGKWTAGQRAIVDRFDFRHRDCSQWASQRLADDGKSDQLRGLEFRQREGWDWRTDAVQPEYPACLPDRPVQEKEQMRTAYLDYYGVTYGTSPVSGTRADKAILDDIAF